MASTTMYRKTTCTRCGYSQTTTTSYYLDRKQWNLNHLPYHKMSVVSANVESKKG